MNELTEVYEQLTEAFESFRLLVKRTNPRLYERWKAGGFIVSDDIVSMYPNITEVYEQIQDENEENDDEDETDDEDELPNDEYLGIMTPIKTDD